MFYIILHNPVYYPINSSPKTKGTSEKPKCLKIFYEYFFDLKSYSGTGSILKPFKSLNIHCPDQAYTSLATEHLSVFILYAINA